MLEFLSKGTKGQNLIVVLKCCAVELTIKVLTKLVFYTKNYLLGDTSEIVCNLEDKPKTVLGDDVMGKMTDVKL